MLLFCLWPTFGSEGHMKIERFVYSTVWLKLEADATFELPLKLLVSRTAHEKLQEL